MSFPYISKRLFVLFFCFWMWSCLGDAPRNNPLDPSNENSTLSSLNGSVLTYRVPHQAIPGVKVIWENNNIYTYTENPGTFDLKDVTREPGWLFFETNAYLYDSVFIDWKTISSGVEKYLNTKPVLQNVLFYSSIRNRYPDRKIINLNINADISDADNDVDSVLIQSKSLGVSTYLNYDAGKKVYQRSLTMSDLNINSADEVIGHVFQIFVRDILNNKILLTEEIVKRIVKEEVITKAAESDTLSLTPTLNWEPIVPGFPCSFMVEIYIDDINPPLVWSLNDINSTTTSITVDKPLEENRYFWIVWVIDEFENRSASKPKTFYAKNL